MMKRLLSNLVSLLALTLTFGAGAVVGIVSHIGDPVAYVHITNHTSQSIKAMRFTHERGLETYPGVPVGETHIAIVPARGETSFSTTVELADGRQLVDKPQYAEGGYTFYVTVDDDRIATQVNVISMF